MRRYLDQQLKLRQIRAISAIATHGSLLRASKVLSISQPALTKTLHEAEDGPAIATQAAAPRATRIALGARGVKVDCALQAKFGPLPAG